MGLFGLLKGKSNTANQDDNYGIKKLQQQTANADKDIQALREADEQFKLNGNLDARIRVYEKFLNKKPDWNSFNKCISLAEMYIKAGNNNKAWAYLNKIITWFSNPKGPRGDLAKVRKLQFKILKAEEKYDDAFVTLVYAYVVSAYTPTQTVVFNKEKFLKEIKTTAKALNIPEKEMVSFSDRLEKSLKKKKITEIEAKEYCIKFLKAYS